MASNRVKHEDATTQFKKFREYVKALSGAFNMMILLPGGLTVLDHPFNGEDTLITENYAVWKDNKSEIYYQWSVVDPIHFTAKMKEYDVKIKGTEVLDFTDHINVLKNGDAVYEIERMEGTTPEKINKAASFYRKMKDFLYIWQNCEWIDISDDLFEEMKSGKMITLSILDDLSIYLAKSIFPLLKKTTKKMQYTIAEIDRKANRVYLLFKENHDDFDLYTLVACAYIGTK